MKSIQQIRNARTMLADLISRRCNAAPPELEWVVACSVFSVGSGRDKCGHPLLRIAVSDADDLRHIPKELKLSHWREPTPFSASAGCIPMAQSGTGKTGLSIYNATRADSNSSGTVCALVQDQKNPERLGILSAAHVLAAAPDTQLWDSARIGIHGSDINAQLRHWWPTLGIDAPHVDLDAALMDVDRDTAKQLMELMPIPVGYSGFLTPGMEVSVFGSASQEALIGEITGESDTLVRITRTDGTLREYFLRDAIHYDAKTHGGDSGAPVFNQRNELVGMHCAEGLFWRITRVLDEKIGFDLDLVTDQSRI